jgi:hypothetical protein
MQRLTLILSDLFLPEEAVALAPSSRPISLPALDGLLRFADASRRIADWRTWLAGELEQLPLAILPVAQVCALGLLEPRAAVTCWLATPVHLEARLDHVRLTDRGLLRLDAVERTAWCLEFARAFGPEYALHDAGERGFLLSGLARTDARTVDPARLLDADIGPELPAGPAASELRRLGAEIEMWLHVAPLNAAREQRRQPRISALWLWGGGVDGSPGESAAVAPRSASPRDVHFFGADPFIASLARSVVAVRAEPRVGADSATYHDIENVASHAVVEQAPMTGPAGQSLPSLEARWFTPMCTAMSAGSLATCDLIANDRWFRIRAGGGWKFWRRRVHWLKRLTTTS